MENYTNLVGIKMKLSTKSRYGLKIMYFLAQNNSDNFQNVSNIAIATGVSEKYIEKLLSGLKNANLIVSSRGNDGGYKLINAPSAITCGQILRAMEEDLVFADFLVVVHLPPQDLVLLVLEVEDLVDLTLLEQVPQLEAFLVVFVLFVVLCAIINLLLFFLSICKIKKIILYCRNLYY